MTLRITQGMLTSSFLNNLNVNLRQFQKYSEHLETTRRINRPSDDPVGALYTMRYRAEIRHLKQYKDNVNYAQSWIDETETLINSVNDIVKRAYELAVYAANDTNDGQPREAIADEIDELRDELLGIANKKFQGRYVFGGDETNNKPYELNQDGTHADPDTGQMELEIGAGIKIEVNITGNEVFGSGDDSIFKILTDFSDALRTSDVDGINNAIKELQDHNDDVLSKAYATIGARYQRIMMAAERLENSDYHLKSFLSKTEDADIPETITKLKMVESVYMSSLSVGARIIQPSLIDFLK